MGPSDKIEENDVNVAVSSIRDKLTCVEDLLLKSNAKKKINEDQRFQKIYQSIADLNLKLKQEVEKRRESRDHLKKTTEYAANAMLEQLQCKLTRRVTMLTERLERLINKCAMLETNVNDMTQKLHSAFNFQALYQDVNTLNRDIKHDLMLKKEKDTDLSGRVMELDYRLKAKNQDATLLCYERIKEIKNEQTALTEFVLKSTK
ncbi:SF-assemblin-beta-giardin [Babesia duncani]|uniref:SF-assemblin-beta-giardin n=1 Tax=Babesia duncani TaxID=323732 RepID=A0AAD9UN68_9APIC|nr:SF-assemblin-beta-giardin [Babesia duncani]